VLRAEAILLLECKLTERPPHIHSTRKVAYATNYPTHALVTAGMGNYICASMYTMLQKSDALIFKKITQ